MTDKSSPTSPKPARVEESPLIEVRGLECRYDEEVVLRDINFSVARGEIFFVIGGSGCGKSTLLRHLVGLQAPAAGTIHYAGQDFLQQGASERRRMLRTFGVLFQSGALWSSLTLRENVSLPLEIHTRLSRREREELVALKLSQVGLGEFGDYYPSEISGGMRKRAGLARALALDPAIVFFDEPSAGLDPITARQMDDLIQRMRELFGTTMVIVSHDLRSIFRLADRIALLDRDARGIIATGTPQQLREESDDPRVRAFLGDGPGG